MPDTVGATAPFGGDGVDAVGAVVRPGVSCATVSFVGDGAHGDGAVAAAARACPAASFDASTRTT